MMRWWRSLDGIGRTAVTTVGVVLVMGALAWAAIPAYNLFCRVTGYGGTTARSETPSDVVLDQEVTLGGEVLVVPADRFRNGTHLFYLRLRDGRRSTFRVVVTR